MQKQISINLSGIDPLYKNTDFHKIPIHIRLAYVKVLILRFIEQINKSEMIDSFYIDDLRFMISDYLDNSATLDLNDLFEDEFDDSDDSDDSLYAEQYGEEGYYD